MTPILVFWVAPHPVSETWRRKFVIVIVYPVTEIKSKRRSIHMELLRCCSASLPVCIITSSQTYVVRDMNTNMNKGCLDNTFANDTDLSV